MRGVAARVSLHHIVMICCDEYCRCCIGASGFVRMVRKWRDRNWLPLQFNDRRQFPCAPDFFTCCSYSSTLSSRKLSISWGRRSHLSPSSATAFSAAIWIKNLLMVAPWLPSPCSFRHRQRNCGGSCGTSPNLSSLRWRTSLSFHRPSSSNPTFDAKSCKMLKRVKPLLFLFYGRRPDHDLSSILPYKYTLR